MREKSEFIFTFITSYDFLTKNERKGLVWQKKIKKLYGYTIWWEPFQLLIIRNQYKLKKRVSNLSVKKKKENMKEMHILIFKLTCMII